MFLHDALTRGLVRYLTAELPSYQRRVPNDVERLRAGLRPGDVVLVEGKSRISRMIMSLSQSSWSHAAMYIGDALLRRGGPHAESALDRFGAEAAHLVLESDMAEGVRVFPVAWYADHNLRVCRPQGLSPGDLEQVVAEMLRHLGLRYDRRNIFDLGRYLTPVHLLPARWRRRPLYLGSSSSREVICSALIAKAFYRVGFPVQPLVGDASASHSHQVIARHPSYIMPRDFDLSANFEVLKVNLAPPEKAGAWGRPLAEN
ncbi:MULTISPECIES: YiiX/YebB-like N1pC/P60 family cysteine hydrolase [Geothrix]|uniref:YiiX/YebB-like N1pC/P60 family cysteine hydrolase n=1 Tax=Geothrix TaxID=44675 RepID=UPI001FAC6BF7|nr:MULTISPECIES: YiiX/YebB-like N1pC/P60 family cysteine hydrolase [Geothrix]